MSCAAPEQSAEPEYAGEMVHRHDVESELVSRLRVIEDQPLTTRAAAYASVHEELARRLESAPADERA